MHSTRINFRVVAAGVVTPYLTILALALPFLLQGH
jgi:hypothetical protein